MSSSTSLPSPARWVRAALALAAVALLPGCNFWDMNGPQSTIHVDGPVARSQLGVFYVTCWVTLVIFILVGSVLAYTTLKFRAPVDAANAEPPPQGHGNPLVELGLIAGSVLALVFIAIPTLKAIWYTHDVPGAESRAKLDEMVKAGTAYEINATGYQWWFKFEYPTEQAEVPETQAKTLLLTANELIIPAGKPVRINIRSADVIHSFWVPKLGGKVDMIPNRGNFLWLEADKPGYYFGQCAEYCGDSHAVMRFRVIALAPDDFKAWLDRETAPARTVTATNVAVAAATPQMAAARKPADFKRNEIGFPKELTTPEEFFADWRKNQAPAPGEDLALITKGKELFGTKTCVVCHTIRGHGAPGVTAPDLTHVGSRSSIAGGLLHNDPEQLQRWIHNPGVVKQGNKMAKGYIDQKITLTDEDERALVAYLSSLK